MMNTLPSSPGYGKRRPSYFDDEPQEKHPKQLRQSKEPTLASRKPPSKSCFKLPFEVEHDSVTAHGSTWHEDGQRQSAPPQTTLDWWGQLRQGDPGGSRTSRAMQFPIMSTAQPNNLHNQYGHSWQDWDVLSSGVPTWSTEHNREARLRNQAVAGEVPLGEEEALRMPEPFVPTPQLYEPVTTADEPGINGCNESLLGFDSGTNGLSGYSCSPWSPHRPPPFSTGSGALIAGAGLLRSDPPCAPHCAAQFEDAVHETRSGSGSGSGSGPAEAHRDDGPVGFPLERFAMPLAEASQIPPPFHDINVYASAFSTDLGYTNPYYDMSTTQPHFPSSIPACSSFGNPRAVPTGVTAISQPGLFSSSEIASGPPANARQSSSTELFGTRCPVAADAPGIDVTDATSVSPSRNRASFTNPNIYQSGDRHHSEHWNRAPQLPPSSTTPSRHDGPSHLWSSEPSSQSKGALPINGSLWNSFVPMSSRRSVASRFEDPRSAQLNQYGEAYKLDGPLDQEISLTSGNHGPSHRNYVAPETKDESRDRSPISDSYAHISALVEQFQCTHHRTSLPSDALSESWPSQTFFPSTGAFEAVQTLAESAVVSPPEHCRLPEASGKTYVHPTSHRMDTSSGPAFHGRESAIHFCTPLQARRQSTPEHASGNAVKLKMARPVGLEAKPGRASTKGAQSQPQGSQTDGQSFGERRIQLAFHTAEDVGNGTERPSGSSSSRKPHPRGRFKPEDRAETANTRRNKACVRCRLQRVRCLPDPGDPSGDCLTCARVDCASRKTTRPVFCMRHKLTSIVLSRPAGSLKYTRRWGGARVADVPDRLDVYTEPVGINMMQKVCPRGSPLHIKVRRFKPREGDQIHKEWWDSEEWKTFTLKPYALASVRATTGYLKSYVVKNASAAISEYLSDGRANDMDVESNAHRIFHGHLRSHFVQALLQYQSKETPEVEKKLLSNLFNLWFAAQLTLGSSWLEGEETLGMSPPKDPTCFSGRDQLAVPTPKMVIAQFDMLNPLHVIGPYRDLVLKDLEQLIQSTNPRCFFTVYIAIFILLHLVAVTCQDRRAYALRHCEPLFYDMPCFIENLQRSAVVMLYYWDYYKGRGSTLDEDDLERRCLTSEQSGLISQTMGSTAQLPTMADDAGNHKFQRPEFWIGQMYDTNWSPCAIYSAPHY